MEGTSSVRVAFGVALACGLWGLWWSLSSPGATEGVPPSPPHRPLASSDLSISPAPTDRRDRSAALERPPVAAPVGGEPQSQRPHIKRSTSRLPPQIEPSPERAELRKEDRQEVLRSIRERVAQHAEERGWSADVTADVDEIVSESTEKISRVLTQVDRGEMEWNKVRNLVRQYRFDSAEEVRERLGEEEWGAFVVGMDWERFEGDRWVWGRLD